MSPGDVAVFTATITVPTTAIAGETYANTAVSTAADGTTGEDDHTVTVIDPGEPDEPELTVTKTGDVTQVAPGGTVHYTITATNTGNTELTDVEIADTISGTGTGVANPTLTYDAGSSTTAAVVTDNTATIATMSPGDVVTFTATITVPTTAAPGETYTNTAVSTAADGTTGEDDHTVTVVEPDEPELTVTKTGDVTQVAPGGTVHYTITATNTGNTELTDVEIVDTIGGSGTGVANPTLIYDAGASTTAAVITDNTATIASMSPGDVVVFTATITIPITALPGETYVNTAISTATDGTTGEDDHTVTVVEPDEPDLPPSGGGGTGPTVTYEQSITKTLASGQNSVVNRGSTVNYQITVKNTGSGTLTNVRVTDIIAGNEVLLGTIESLAAGASRVFPFTYAVPLDASYGSVIRNTALMTSNEAEEASSFVDVMVDLLTADHIWYIRGYEDNTVRPAGNLTRAEATMVFYRLLNPSLKTDTYKTSRFRDVNAVAWYGLAVGTLTELGILDGYPDGSFQPNRPISRAELAKIVAQFDSLLSSSDNPFPDVAKSHWAYAYITSSTEKGWFQGYPDGAFRPDNNLNRAEFVTVVNNMRNRHILEEDLPQVHKFVDLVSSHWAYTAIIEACYTHDFERKPDGLNEIWTEITDDGFSAAYNQ
jgi:uncharacterized repeat protein (TIGR01451 family)